MRNFKAVKDSKIIKYTPLTVFIGNNGSGKSSMVEAMETFQILTLHDIDEAMQQWHGFEHIWNKSKAHKQVRGRVTNPMTFALRGMDSNEKFKCYLEIVSGYDVDRHREQVFFQSYRASYASVCSVRDYLKG